MTNISNSKDHSLSKYWTLSKPMKRFNIILFASIAAGFLSVASSGHADSLSDTIDAEVVPVSETGG